MELPDARARVAAARVGRLATVTRQGSPHVVACCFALDGDQLYSAVDAKPKATLELRRLDNVRAHGRASLLVDHYEEDWSALWWVRVDGPAEVIDAGARRDHALGVLAAKYPQYRSVGVPGAVIALRAEAWRWWSASL